MFARYHGEAVPLKAPTSADLGTRTATAFAQSLRATVDALVTQEATGRSFGFLFENVVSDPDNRLPEGSDTIRALKALGEAMGHEDPGAPTGDGPIPAAYTYFGQFIDHDITGTRFDITIGVPGLTDIIELPTFDPLPPHEISTRLSNARTAPLDLDSVYGGLAASCATGADGRMMLSTVTTADFGSIPTADKLHDLPRRSRIRNPSTPDEQREDREALIGDPRNDENLLVAQLHLAFLRSHNALMDGGLSGAQARTKLRRLYQHAVIVDFLDRICHEQTLAAIRSGSRRFKPTADDLFIPVEFSGAAYRFGHSMVRQVYEHNRTFNSSGVPGTVAASFNFMFTFSALSGELAPAPTPGSAPLPPSTGSDTLPDNWVIEWHRFFEAPGSPASENPARRIDTNLAIELGRLPDAVGRPINALMGRLAARNLLRGYLLGLPTGQAVARELGLAPLTSAALLDAVPTGDGGAARALFAEQGFADRTPLWFYVLAEAGLPSEAGGQDGAHLGPVGTTIVAETLIALAEHAPDSVLTTPLDPADQALATLKGIVRLGMDAALPPIG